MVKKKLAEFFCADQLGQFLKLSKFGCLILFLVLVGRFVSLVAHHWVRPVTSRFAWLVRFVYFLGRFVHSVWSKCLVIGFDQTFCF